MSEKAFLLNHPGDTYKDYVLKKVYEIEELQCLLKIIEHTPTRAEIIHLENDDPENVFCLSLRTLPDSSNGVAHILEHTVLCGSDKFPVKDPFFSMNRRSLNTYMNALTASDFTCYPAASQVEKDFYNLLEVYLDAVFHPKLKELSFLQEGHRLEFTDPKDPKSPLTYKGIVFNEMKGALSSPIARLWQEILESLFPDTLYRHNSGGEPKIIPQLTYQQLLDFHAQYYQKSRCAFYFSGNLPTRKHLDFLDKHAFKGAEALSPLPYNPIQPRFCSPKSIKSYYPIALHEKTASKTYVALSWLTASLTEHVEVLALHILDIILMGTDAAPLKIKLLRSGLSHSVFSSFEDELSEVPYSLIFEGCEENQAEALKAKVLETLKEIAAKPIDPEQIEIALHQFEFSRTEISGDYGPFGLFLILKLIPIHNVGGELDNTLKVHSLFKELRTHLKDPNFLPSLIKKHFLENTHCSTIEMVPDPKLADREEMDEKQTLKEMQEKLTPQLSELLIQKAEELETFQNKLEGQDLEVLPKVTLEDVPKKPRSYPLTKEHIGPLTVFHHDCFTNNVIYLDFVYKIPKMSVEDLPYVRLFAHLLTQVGSGNRDYVENLEELQRQTGGIYAALDTQVPVENVDFFEPHLIVQGKALDRKRDKFLSLFYEMITSPNFEDPERLKELLNQLYIELSQSLKQNSLTYATSLSYKGFSAQGFVRYYWFGLGYYELIKKIAQNWDKELPILIAKLNELKERLLHGNDPHLILSCSESQYNSLKQHKFGHFSKIQPKKYIPFTRDYHFEKEPSQALISSSPVFFTAMSIQTPGFSDPDVAYLNIASKLLDNTVLHRLIREQGGAYGGGTSNRMGSGFFSFYAYRDPNLADTVSAFLLASQKIADGEFSERELEEAKLGVIQQLDRPILPENRAFTAYTWLQEGKSLEFREKIRDRILNATSKDIQKATEYYLLAKLKYAVLVTFGSKEKLEKETQRLIKEQSINLEVKLID